MVDSQDSEGRWHRLSKADTEMVYRVAKALSQLFRREVTVAETLRLGLALADNPQMKAEFSGLLRAAAREKVAANRKQSRKRPRR